MSAVAYPNVLLPATWDKNKGLLAKTKPTGIGAALKTLAKQHDGITFDKFEPGKVRTIDEAEARLDQLDGAVRKAVKSTSDAARVVEGLGKKWEGEFKKDKLIPKSATQAAGDVAKAAAAYSAALGRWLDEAEQGIEKRMTDLLAAEARNGKPVETKEFKLVRGKLLSALRAVKADKRDAPATHFMIGVGKTGCAVYMAPSVSASHKTLLMKLMAGDSGFKFHVGTCIWEAKAYTFVGGASMPTGGLAKKVQKALKDLTKGLYKVRVKRDTGEVDEVDGNDDPDLIPDDEDGTPPKASSGTGQSPQGTAPKTVPDANAQVARFRNIRVDLDKLALKDVAFKDKLAKAEEQFKALLAQKKPGEALKVLELLEARAQGEPGRDAKPQSPPPVSGKVESAGLAVDKALETVRLAIAAIPQAKVQVPLAGEFKALKDQKALAMRLAEAEALKQLAKIAGDVVRLGKKAEGIRDSAVDVTGKVKAWGTDRVAAAQKEVNGLAAAGKAQFQRKVDAQQVRVQSALVRMDKGDYPGAEQEVTEVYFAIEQLLIQTTQFKNNYEPYRAERDKAEAAIKKLKAHAQADALKAEIRNLEQRLLAADKLGAKTPGLGWQQARIAIKPLLELCARQQAMADKLAKVAAKLPALTKKLEEGGADEASAKKMAVYAQKMLVEEDCSDDEAVDMAKDANGFATDDGMDEQDALMSSRVKHSLVKSGIDAGVAKEIGRNVRAGGSSSGDDAKAVAKGLTRLSKPVLENLNKAGITTQCCRGPATEVLADLSGVQPRGWPDGMTWDDVPGCYSPSTKQVIVGTMEENGKRKVPGPGEGPIPHGTPDLIGHEAGHAFDASDGTLKSTNADFLKARAADVKLGKPKGMYGPRDNYFLTKAEGGTNDAGATSETFAESFAMHFAKNSRWPTLEAFWVKNPWGI